MKDPWVVVNTTTKVELYKRPTKKEALDIADTLNKREVANGRTKVFAVLPRRGGEEDVSRNPA